MNKLRVICLGLVFCLSVNIADAHMYGRPVAQTTSTGFKIYSYKWHADDPWEGARIYSAPTNYGTWTEYPGTSLFHRPVEGIVGPVTPNRWYRTKFYHVLLYTKTIGMVFIGADICGVGPPIREL